jgi:hypothetical protein
VRHLSILDDRFPKAFYFRITEGVEQYDGYAEWAREFDRLQGIQGKALAEEKSDRNLRHVRAYTRFKREHPEQMVILHFNGNARDPGYETGDFFAGHWLYTNGAAVLSDIPDDHNGVSEVRVSDTSLFTLYTGRFFDRGEDIGICDLDDDGKPDWRRSEQVQLVGIDPDRGTITVRRGCHGTRPIGFEAGKAYLAPHIVEGPWNGPQNNLMWFYNYSTHCPRDEQGRTCADVLADWLARTFGPTGPLAEYDGLEFDVLFASLYNHPYRYLQATDYEGRKTPDCDGDGVGDMGIFDGVDTYGVGVIEFCRDLRQKMGDDRLILADAGWWHGQRSFDLLNGIESEGMELDEQGHCAWGHMLNTHRHWNHRGRNPKLSYLMLTRRTPTPTDGAWRIGMAVAAMAGSANAVSNRPGAHKRFGGPAGDTPDDWDELCNAGQAGPGWLGAPTGELIRLATREPDLLDGAGSPPGEALRGRIASNDADVSLADGALVATGRGGPAGSEGRMTVRLTGVNPGGADLLVMMRAHGEPMPGYPVEGQRLVWLTATRDGQPVVQGEHRFGTKVRRHAYLSDDGYVNAWYYNDLPAGPMDLSFEFEGVAPMRIEELRLFGAVDACVREFEHGAIVANPSKRPYSFDMAALFPGRRFRRIKGRANQCPDVNTGEPVGETLTLPTHDALFLVAE